MPRPIVASLFRAIFRFILRYLVRLEVEGFENLPAGGGYILATNHLSILDPPFIYALFDRHDVTALVAKKHQKNFVFRWIINGVNGIWLNRDEADTRALRAATAHLQAGGILGIAPEGTRSRTGGLIAGKTGVAYLADKAGVPIIAVAIIGTENAIPKILILQRPRITIRFGRPFHLPALERGQRDALLRTNTEEIMSRIAALLPPSYRGVYADHPRLQELHDPERNIEQRP